MCIPIISAICLQAPPWEWQRLHEPIHSKQSKRFPAFSAQNSSIAHGWHAAIESLSKMTHSHRISAMWAKPARWRPALAYCSSFLEAHHGRHRKTTSKETVAVASFMLTPAQTYPYACTRVPKAGLDHIQQKTVHNPRVRANAAICITHLSWGHKNKAYF